MERAFTKPMGHYKAGEIHDWPITTWQHIADHEGVRIAEFSRAVKEVVEGTLGKPKGHRA